MISTSSITSVFRDGEKRNTEKGIGREKDIADSRQEIDEKSEQSEKRVADREKRTEIEREE